jgi:hypothetical protein
MLVVAGLAAALVAARAPAPPAAVGVYQGSLIGRYVLRTVNGKALPVTLPGEDIRHTVQVSDGVLELNPDGTYLCRTVASVVHLGLKETFADTLQGAYTILQAGAIQFGHKGVKADTVTTSGFQITWPHPVRTYNAVFQYSK